MLYNCVISFIQHCCRPHTNSLLIRTTAREFFWRILGPKEKKILGPEVAGIARVGGGGERVVVAMGSALSLSLYSSPALG